jgi:hypothetical protein
VSDGESALVTAEGRGLVLLDSVLDALVSESPLAQAITLSEGVGALPSTRKVEVAVGGNVGTIVEIGPVESTLLLVGTFVLGVVGSSEVVIEVPRSGNVLGGEPGKHESVLHGDCV